MTLRNFLLDVVAAGIIYGLLSLLQLKEPFATLLKVVFVLIALALVLRLFGMAPTWVPRW